MRRFALTLLAVSLISACSDRRAPTAPTAPTDRPRSNVDVPACISLTSDEVVALINGAFGARTPDANSALGKWDNIEKQKAAGHTVELVNKTWNLVDFILTKRRDADLPLTDDVQKLVNYLFCFAGIDSALPDGDAWIVYPTDAARTLVTDDGQAGLFVPAGAVGNTSLIAITETTEPLRTDLDTYPTNYQFSKYPSNVFSSSVTAALCATAPDAVIPHLVLGHNKGVSDFELLVTQSVSFLSCSSSASVPPKSSMLDRLVALVLPKFAHAAVRRGVVGVGGSVIEFSEIGPVDPRIRVTANTTGSSAPIGSLVTPPPSITLATPNGTALDGIPVAFAIVSGGGTITPASVSSGSSGVASASWRLGMVPGTNSASATPANGGDAVPGVIFDPASHTFTATANPPSALVITGGPGGGSHVAGSTLPTPTVTAVDMNGTTVEGFAANITVSAAPGPLQGTLSKAAVSGIASFTDLVVTKAGSHTLTASAPYGAGTLTATTASFTITASSAAQVLVNDGNNQSAPAGTTLGLAPFTAPSVKVVDQYANPVAGATIHFAPSNNSAVVNPLSATTNASGIASTSWTLLPGTNEMVASLDAALSEDASRYTFFTATGTTSSQAFLACGPGNQRDPITSYFVRMDGTNKKITDVKFFFSINGAAKQPVGYPMRVTATVYANSSAVVSTIASQVSTVFLRGNNSEDKEANFRFPGAGITSGNGTRIVFAITTTTPTSNTISYNAGDCAPGTKCSVRPACPAVQVPTSNPFNATAYRQSAGIRLYGY